MSELTPTLAKALAQHSAGKGSEDFSESLEIMQVWGRILCTALCPVVLGLIFAELTFVYGGL